MTKSTDEQHLKYLSDDLGMGYSIEKEAEKVTNKQVLQITLPFFNLGEQNRIFLFESQTNFM